MKRYALMAAVSLAAFACTVATEPDEGTDEALHSLDEAPPPTPPSASEAERQVFDRVPIVVERTTPTVSEPSKPTPDPWYVIPTKPTPDPWAPDEDESQDSAEEDTSTSSSSNTSHAEAQSASLDPNAQ